GEEPAGELGPQVGSEPRRPGQQTDGIPQQRVLEPGQPAGGGREAAHGAAGGADGGEAGPDRARRRGRRGGGGQCAGDGGAPQGGVLVAFAPGPGRGERVAGGDRLARSPARKSV